MFCVKCDQKLWNIKWDARTFGYNEASLIEIVKKKKRKESANIALTCSFLWRPVEFSSSVFFYSALHCTPCLANSLLKGKFVVLNQKTGIYYILTFDK